jgi:GT2 family glycosyltransferase
MVAAAEASPRAAVVAPAILYYASPHRLNAAGSSLLPSGFYAARGKDRDYRHYRQRQEIAAASGCCFLYRASVYREVGGFDAVFDSLPGGWHASAEDLDLSWRVWRAGYTVLYQPDAILWHKYEQRPLHQARFASLVAGRLAFLAMNFPGWPLLWFAPLLLLTEAMLGAYSLVRGIAFLRAWLDGYRWLWGNRRRLRELRGTRAARYHATPKRLLGLLQPAIRLAPAVERNPLLWLASKLWFGVNALTLGAARLTASTAGGASR